MPDMLGTSTAGACTLMENAGREADALPSLTLIRMLPQVPAADECGVPESCPVLVLNVAQVGAFAMLKVSGRPCGSLANGVKLYCEPASTQEAGVPEIVGPVLAAAKTAIENAGSEAVAPPPVTLI